jgi:hypothetical protein
MKTLTGHEMVFVASRGEKLSWGFTACDRNFYINVGKAALA